MLVYTFHFILVGGSKVPFGRKSFPCLLSSFTLEAQIMFVTSICYPMGEDWLNWNCPVRGGLVSQSDISHGWMSFWNTSTFFSYQAPCFCHHRCLCWSTGKGYREKSQILAPIPVSGLGEGEKPNQTKLKQPRPRDCTHDIKTGSRLLYLLSPLSSPSNSYLFPLG